jgi:hypothetical protein
MTDEVAGSREFWHANARAEVINTAMAQFRRPMKRMDDSSATVVCSERMV